MNICLQINISAEPTKSGILLQELGPMADHIMRLPNLRLRGLMAIPKACDNVASQRRVFARLATAAGELQRQCPGVDTLSMGMSNDLEAAVAEGATMVRIGTAIFGPRQ